MFGLSFGEILIILVVALLVLGPTGMPKLARTLGKGLRDFRRATGDIRGAFEQEFYKLDQEVEKAARLETLHAAPDAAEPAPAAPPALAPPEGALARPATPQPATEPTSDVQAQTPPRAATTDEA